MTVATAWGTLVIMELACNCHIKEAIENEEKSPLKTHTKVACLHFCSNIPGEKLKKNKT
jgi:hypothetical protein